MTSTLGVDERVQGAGRRGRRALLDALRGRDGQTARRAVRGAAGDDPLRRDEASAPCSRRRTWSSPSGRAAPSCTTSTPSRSARSTTAGSPGTPSRSSPVCSRSATHSRAPTPEQEHDHDRRRPRLRDLHRAPRSSGCGTRLIDPEYTTQYFHGTRFESTFEPGAPFVSRIVEPDRPAVDGTIEVFEPPRGWSYTWHVLYDAEMAEEPPGRVEWKLDAGQRRRLGHAGHAAPRRPGDEPEDVGERARRLGRRDRQAEDAARDRRADAAVDIERPARRRPTSRRVAPRSGDGRQQQHVGAARRARS